MQLFRRVRRTRKGDFQLRLPEQERDLLRSLPAQLKELLASDDPALERLFPPAYADDPDRNADYQRLMHDELLDHRRAAADVMEATIDADRLDEGQLVAWLSAINDLRLVLGTRLDVTEDMYGEEMPEDDPRAPAFAVYSYLGWLEEQVVDALAAGLPDEGRED
jgi:hypothetical protein